MSPFTATIADIVPLGTRFLLSVRFVSVGGSNLRPELPCKVMVSGTNEVLTLLEVISSPTLWLLGEVTLLAEAAAPVNWQNWRGRMVVGADPEAE